MENSFEHWLLMETDHQGGQVDSLPYSSPSLIVVVTITI